MSCVNLCHSSEQPPILDPTKSPCTGPSAVIIISRDYVLFSRVEWDIILTTSVASDSFTNYINDVKT